MTDTTQPGRPPVPSWFLALVHELMQAGNQLAELIDEPLASEIEKNEAVQRWERVLAATGKAA